MDEFMTLRRLNIRIQGFPESYATEPYMTAEATLAVGDHMQHPIAPPLPPEMSSMIHPGDPQHHLSNGVVGMPTSETPEIRSTGVGDGSLYDGNADTLP